MINLIQPITVQQAYNGITHARWWASWNWWWRMVDDGDGDGFPSPEPRTDSRSALSREFRAWRKLHIVKRNESFSLIFFSSNMNIWSWSWGRWSTRGPTRQGACPHPRGQGVGPWPWFFRQYFLYFPKKSPFIFRSFQEHLFLHKNNTIAILLKIVSVRVSSIQNMQIRVQSKGKRVWKSRYNGDVSIPRCYYEN